MDGGERVVPSCFAIQVAIAAVETPITAFIAMLHFENLSLLPNRE